MHKWHFIVGILQEIILITAPIKINTTIYLIVAIFSTRKNYLGNRNNENISRAKTQ